MEAAESRLGVAGGREAVAGGAALSLMRLHHVYNLHAHHLAQGSPAPLAEGARPRRHSAAKRKDGLAVARAPGRAGRGRGRGD